MVSISEPWVGRAQSRDSGVRFDGALGIRLPGIYSFSDVVVLLYMSLSFLRARRLRIYGSAWLGRAQARDLGTRLSGCIRQSFMARLGLGRTRLRDTLGNP